MKVKLTKMTHFLKGSLSMTEPELAQITDTQIRDYALEYNTSIPEDFEEDLNEAHKLNVEVVALTEEVYGTNSNQHKYVQRNWQKGQDIVQKHYNRYEKPSHLKYRVEDARLTHTVSKKYGV